MKRGPLKWLEFSRGDLRRAVVMAGMRDYDYAAYLLQQSAEKAIKAVILKKIPTISGKEIKTHNIRLLLRILERNGTQIPGSISRAVDLTRYAFEVRYPDDYRPVSEEEYEEAYEVAVRVYEWDKGIVENQP